MVATEQKVSFPVSMTEHAVMSPAGIFAFDSPKTAEEHFHSFCDLAGAKLIHAKSDGLALVCGVESGIVVIQIGIGRGSFVPDLNPGRYGVEHTNLGNLVTKTKRIVDVNNRCVHLVFGIVRDQWPDGLNSCTLVQSDLQGRGTIDLLADNSIQPIEPTLGFRFYTPFKRIPGAGNGFLAPDGKALNGASSVYPLYPLGIMTLNRQQLSELLRAFNGEWTNGPVFACKSKIRQDQVDDNGDDGDTKPEKKKEKTHRRKKQKKEGLDQWC
jgi:hypothetical protein